MALKFNLWGLTRRRHTSATRRAVVEGSVFHQKSNAVVWLQVLGRRRFEREIGVRTCLTNHGKTNLSARVRSSGSRCTKLPRQGAVLVGKVRSQRRTDGSARTSPVGAILPAAGSVVKLGGAGERCLPYTKPESRHCAVYHAPRQPFRRSQTEERAAMAYMEDSTGIVKRL